MKRILYGFAVGVFAVLVIIGVLFVRNYNKPKEDPIPLESILENVMHVKRLILRNMDFWQHQMKMQKK